MRSLPRVIRRHRRIVVAGLVFVAVWITVGSLRPPSDTVVVLAAARDLAAGATITASDLTELSLPRDALSSAQITDPQAGVGRLLLTPLRAREPVTTTRLLDVRDIPEGQTLISVRIAAEQIRFLRSGDRLDLIGVAQSLGRVLASNVRVVVPATGDSESALLVEVPQSAAPAIAAASANGSLSATIRGNKGG